MPTARRNSIKAQAKNTHMRAALTEAHADAQTALRDYPPSTMIDQPALGWVDIAPHKFTLWCKSKAKGAVANGFPEGFYGIAPPKGISGQRYEIDTRGLSIVAAQDATLAFAESLKAKFPSMKITISARWRV